MIFDSLGSLYGTALWGGSHGAGVAFRLTPGSDDKWSMRVLHHFRGGQDGAYPYAGLAFDAMGNLYGATESGGAYGYGVVFKLTPTSGGKWTEHLLHVFADKPGAYLRGQPIFDASGNLYGTSAGDGHKTFGSVFEITP